jgi:hypothetical protein
MVGIKRRMSSGYDKIKSFIALRLSIAKQILEIKMV